MNKRTEQTRWTPKRLLSLLMALIMTLSLLPTAAFAADGEASTLGTSAANPVVITFSSNQYATADTSLIKKTITEEDDTSYTVTFKPQIQFVDNSGKGTASTFIYQSGIPFKPGVSISTNAHEEKAIGQYTYTVQQVNADGTGAPNTATVTNNIHGTSKIPAASLSCEGSDFTAKALENNMIRLKYTVYEGDSVDENKLVGKVYVGITGITVTDIKYNVSYNIESGGAWVGNEIVDQTTIDADERGNASYTIPSEAVAKKDGCTFKGWRVATSGQTGSVKQPGDKIDGIKDNITLNAVLETNYDITFDSDLTGATGLPTRAQKSSGSTYTIPYTPKLDGYTFEKWEVTSGTATVNGNEVSNIAGNITLTAQWTKDGTTPVGSHSVKFVRRNTTDGSALNWPNDLTGAKDSTVTIPYLIPQAEGYTFLGWSKDQNATTADPDYAYGKEVTIGDTDTSLYAVWRENMVSITYPTSLAGGKVTPGASSVKPGASVTFSVLIAAGYDASSVNVTANGIGLGAVNKTTAQNGVTTLTYTFNPTVDTTILVSAPKKLTYSVTLPISDKVDVSFTNPASDAKSTTVNYGSDVAFKVAARTGYTVKGVYANGQKLKEENGAYTIKDITADQRVTVDVEAIQFHKVTYVVLDKTYLVQDVQHSQTSTVEDPVVEGYTFIGWNTKQNGTGDTFNSTTTVNGNITVYAQLQAVTHQINYDLNVPQDANGNSLTVNPSTLPDTEKTYGKAVTLSAVMPTCDGYDFLGWAKARDSKTVVYAAGATVSEELTADMTLYAVWAKKTYTITLQGGSGYTVSSNQALVVEHGSTFTFTVTVDGAYAATEPTVTISSTANGTLTKTDGNHNSEHKAATYTYTISNVTADQVVTVKVTENARATVTFQYRVVDAQGNEVTVTGLSGETFMTQAVQLGDPAAQPQQPNIEGYKFVRWCGADHTTATHEAYDFTKPVADELTIYAEITPILPVITVTNALSGLGWKTENWQYGTETMTNADTTNKSFTIAYGDNVTFDLVIAKGYDYSKLSVTANGLALGYQSATTDEKTGVTTLHYYLGSVMADTRIAITGIERKTITITYYDNARDDTSNPLAPQIANYYVAGATDNSKFTKQAPVRTGYTFLGWSTDGTAKEATYKWTDIDSTNGLIIEFTKDTTLYAIWEAQDTKLTLNITDVALDKNDGKRVIQYEGEQITLQATLNHFAVGSVTFYKGNQDKTNATIVGSTSIEGTTATFRTTVGEYKTTAKDEYYWAEFTPNADEGYSGSTSGVMNVGIFSKALSWKITEGTSNVADNGNVLNVYEGNGTTTAATEMVAGRTYTLEVKTASITGVETLDSKQPVLGKDYKIVWQYTEVGKNDWKTDGEASDKATYLVTGDKSGYQFRAQIVPLGPDNGSLFVKAGKFENDALVNNQYDTCLYTKSTDTTVRQATATTLTITGAETESKDVWVNGATDKFGRDHLAQFEEQTVTLTANIVDNTTKGAVADGGKVYFYRYVDGKSDTKLNETAVVVNNGVAELTNVKISKYNPEIGVTSNLDKFYAVYETNETYETSASVAKEGDTYKSPADPLKDMVFIKSASLQTPVIMSEKPGMLAGHTANETTYLSPLTDLLAGISHTFTLKATAGSKDATANYSVVALDGRTVDATNYDIKWLKTTGSNEQEVDATGTNQIKVDENKVDDRYRVKLTGKGVFAGSEATSQDAVIGTKQDVTVTVEATDAITKTPVDRENGKYPDVYQLNEITLTATVAAAKGADATMKPTGTVTFYYSVDGTNWTKIGEAKDLAEVAGVMTASIKTDQLPVKANDNTKQDVKITAVYSGDATFNASATVNETEKSITAAAGCTTTNDTVTVYSSVVFNCNDENKKQTTDGDKGIHISVSDGAFKANEKATLALSDIYTLDRELTDETLRNTIAKLNPTTDYTVQWQKLNGATAIGDAEGTDFANSQRWTDIGATGTTLVLDKVEQNTAYRAVITVNDQPITKGSSTEVNQTIKGRQVYYSNVLMPTDTNMTVSVALNTSKIGAENTEGITEGETVTANVFLSGVVGAVPNANVTVKVTNDSAKGNDTAYEKTFTSMNTVNGWNAFSWNTAESDDNGVPTAPGFYTLTVSATTNTGYAAKEITRSLIVRESSYTIVPENTTVTYNGRTQGLTVALNGFGFNGTGINEAANKSWTVKYYDKDNNLVEPTQAGTYRAVITLPASAYWTEQTKTVDFTIEKRSVSIADAIAQAKVYDGTTDVNIVEVMLNDAVTDQTTNGTGLPTNNVGIINGDSIYAVATEAKLSSANAGDNSFTISTIELRGDDANNYEWDKASYTENIYVSRSQVYGEHGTLELKQGETFPADKVIKMIDQSGREITLGTGTEDYTLTFYYHSDTKIEKTTDISKLGLYTVVARPNQSNYKSGVTMQFNVVETATVPTPATTPKASTLIYLNDTATKYNPAGNVPVTAKNAQGNTVKVEYHGTTWSETVPSYAGRYLVKATDTSTGDVAYGIYTITKAHPSIGITAAEATYNSMPYTGATPDLTKATENPEHYLTYAGDVAIGYNTPADGNVDEQAPVDAGTYTVTLHVNETANYTAHEISKSFTIAKKALTIKADSWQTTQYDAFPDMTAGYTGLAAETGDTTPDTSLRDVQIAPEFLYNPTGGKSNYSNDSLDQVGGVAIQPIDALSKNYAITYENGQYTKQRTDANIDLAIHGLPQSSTGTNTVYYGDVIQLYPYGYYTTLGNGSGILEWSVTTAADFKSTVTIGKETGLLNVNGVGEFTVTLKRGVGEQQISTSVTVTAIQKEAKIALKNVDKVYNGASQTYTYTDNVTVHNELYQALPYFDATKVTRTNTDRIDVGTQITTAKVTGAWAYQSETYGGKFTINDKDATVAPCAQSTVYGTLEAFDTNPKYTVTNEVNSVAAVSGVNVASQTDAYNRLDVHDGYEILVAGTEDMNYNVKYTTDETAEDSAVTTYDGMKLYSTTTKAKNELNDATVYGEQANDLDWILDAVKSTTRDSVDYADNLADFDLTDTTGIFIKQDKDDCVGNAKTYKAANREEGNTSSTALAADRTATEKAADDNYELVFSSVTNAKAKNYRLDNNDVKNEKSTMTAPTGTVGFIGAAATSDNLIEGSANIAQRPIKLEKAVTDAQLYWRLPQSQLYTALVNILKAEENSVGRGLAKGHTIEDLDLSFTIGSTPVDKNNDQPMTGLTVGTQTVTVTVGDTNYKLEGGQYQFDIVLKNIQIEATYTTKTFTGFTVLIKVHNENGTITPLNDAKGLSYKIFKKTGNTIDKTTAYASGTLTYQNRTAYDDKGGLCGVFTATYPQLPLLNSGETYFIQMYEYGVELKTNS